MHVPKRGQVPEMLSVQKQIGRWLEIPRLRSPKAVEGS